jgi:hypothetical protein
VFPLVSESLDPAEGSKGGAGGEGAGKAALIIFHHIVLTQASTAKRKTLHLSYKVPDSTILY